MPERGGGRAARPSEVGLRCPPDVAVAAADPSPPSPSALVKQHLGGILASTPVSSSFGVHSSAHLTFFPPCFVCILVFCLC